MWLKSKTDALLMDSSSPMALITDSGNSCRSTSTTPFKPWKPCFNYAKGTCRFGDGCRFLHDASMKNTNKHGVVTKDSTTDELLAKLYLIVPFKRLETASQDTRDAVTIHTMTVSQESAMASARTTQSKIENILFHDGNVDLSGVVSCDEHLLSVSLLICLGKHDHVERIPSGNNVVPLRSDSIRLVQNGCSFHGLQFEDPNQHLKDFLKLVDSLDLDGENRERTRLRLFQFSLRDQARNWLESLPAGSITTWEDLTTRFLAQFFPPGRTAKLRNDILMFQQHHG
ncbi:zinc finger, CCHC-type containing protein [Tanacetum coccineum]|uniref:Zinc finger, CCHC-type containing protein n=1 Tax=Tanacetum coccineum TaxID=301880 RepID=A0ABQ5GLY2_9ASTR